MKKWQKLANENGLVEKRAQDILQAYKNKNKKITKKVESNYTFRTFKACNQEISRRGLCHLQKQNWNS